MKNYEHHFIKCHLICSVQQVRSAVLVSLLLVFPASVLASWDGNEIPPSLPSSSESSPATSLAGAQTANKRSISFDSCTGVYDRELLVRLDRVCEDCYNLYRDTDVAVECRYFSIICNKVLNLIFDVFDQPLV